MKYYVDVREIHIQTVEIEADSPEQAITRVAEGDGSYLDGRLEYSHTLPPDTWTVTQE